MANHNRSGLVADFQSSLIQLVLKEGGCVEKIAADAGIRSQLLQKWVSRSDESAEMRLSAGSANTDNGRGK